MKRNFKGWIAAAVAMAVTAVQLNVGMPAFAAENDTYESEIYEISRDVLKKIDAYQPEVVSETFGNDMIDESGAETELIENGVITVSPSETNIIIDGEEFEVEGSEFGTISGNDAGVGEDVNAVDYSKGSGGEVTEFGLPFIHADSGEVNLKLGSSTEFYVTYGNFPGTVTPAFYTNNQSAFDAKWGEWAGKNKIRFQIDAKDVGTGSIVFVLKATKLGIPIAFHRIKISVVQNAKLDLDTYNLTLKKGENRKVEVTYGNYSKPVNLGCQTSSSKLFSTNWINGDRKYLSITGKSEGSGKIEVWLQDHATGNKLVKKTLTVTVIDDKIKLTSNELNPTVYTNRSAVVYIKASGNVPRGSWFMMTEAATNVAEAQFGAVSDQTIPVTIRGLNEGVKEFGIGLMGPNNECIAELTLTVTVKPSSTASITTTASEVHVNAGNVVNVVFKYTNTTAAADLRMKYEYTGTECMECNRSACCGNTMIIAVKGKTGGIGRLVVSLVDANGKEYANCAVNVKVESNGRDVLGNLSYSFSNFGEAASLGVCKQMYGNNEKAKTIYNKESGKNGNCFGMALTSTLFYVPNNGVTTSSFRFGAANANALKLNDKNGNLNMNVKEFIQGMMITQFANSCNQSYIESHELYKLKDLEYLIASETAAGRPVKVGVGKAGKGAHAVVAYGLEYPTNTKTVILIYDNNYPNQTKKLTMNKNLNGVYTSWSFEGYNHIFKSENGAWISYYSYADCKKLWDKRGHLGGGEANLLISNSENFSIKDYEGTQLAYVENGILSAQEEGFEQKISEDLLPDASVSENSVLLYVPSDVYIVENKDEDVKEFELSIAGCDLSSNITTTASEVALCADDDTEYASAMILNGEGKDYKIELGSSIEGQPESQEWEGRCEADVVAVNVNAGVTETVNMNTESLVTGMINTADEAVTAYMIHAEAQKGGKISNPGISNVDEKTSKTYTITADKGYRIGKVYVDGNDYGALSSYTFRDVDKDHEIKAVFTPVTEPEIVRPQPKKTAVDPGKTNLKSAKRISSKKIKLSWKKNAKADQYEIQYSTSKKFTKSKTKTLKAGKNKSAKTLSGLKKGKTYYIRIRSYSYADGLVGIGEWSKVKKVKMKS